MPKKLHHRVFVDYQPSISTNAPATPMTCLTELPHMAVAVLDFYPIMTTFEHPYNQLCTTPVSHSCRERLSLSPPSRASKAPNTKRHPPHDPISST